MRYLTTSIMALALAVGCSFAGADLVLLDGEVLHGADVERKGLLYLLENEDGEIVLVPVELVRQVRLTGEDDPAPSGLVKAEPRTLAGPPEGPDLSRPDEQLEVFKGRQARFAQPAVDPYWRPAANWPGRRSDNEFNPARWVAPVIDPHWTPSSAYRQSRDVTEFSPARFYRSPIDHVWWPRDGFRPSGD